MAVYVCCTFSQYEWKVYLRSRLDNLGAKKYEQENTKYTKKAKCENGSVLTESINYNIYQKCEGRIENYVSGIYKL